MGDTKSIGTAFRDQDLNGSTLTNCTLAGTTSFTTPATVDGVTLGATSGTAGFFGTTPVAKAAAITAQLTSITIADAVGTPDYAIAAVTNTTPWGFSNAAETITLLYVIQNLQARMALMEAKFQAYGLLA